MGNELVLATNDPWDRMSFQLRVLSNQFDMKKLSEEKLAEIVRILEDSSFKIMMVITDNKGFA